MLSGDPITLQPEALAEAKAFARVIGSDEDGVLGTLLGAAAELCENFTGETLIRRSFAETLRPSSAWTRLAARPVHGITSVELAGTGGGSELLAAELYAVDVDAAGEGWVRLTGSIPAGRLRVRYEAGVAPLWSELPEALRQGIVRLVAHLYAHRETVGGEGPPAAVTALWRPWRRMRLV